MDRMESKEKNFIDMLSALSRMPKNASFDVMALYGTPIEKKEATDTLKVYELKNETGTGAISVYRIFSGISVIYNDIHMEYCNRNQSDLKNVIEINHCREGRYECQVGRQSCCYMAAGDFSISTPGDCFMDSCFPLRHYHGISIFIELDVVKEKLSEIFQLLSIDLEHIRNVLRSQGGCIIMRAEPSIEHIFSELYSLRENRKIAYLKVKIAELLLFLSDLEIPADSKQIPYISQKQVRKAKEIQRYITEDICRHSTIEELASIHQMSPTALKNIWKSVYGVPIYTYLKNYRLQIAQKYLLNTNLSVAEISLRIGYENPNKFTSTFKKEYGVTPTEFRKYVRLDR